MADEPVVIEVEQEKPKPKNKGGRKPGHPVSEETRAKQRAAAISRYEMGKNYVLTEEDGKAGRIAEAKLAQSRRNQSMLAEALAKADVRVNQNLSIEDPGDGSSRRAFGAITYALNVSQIVDRLNPQTMMDALMNLISYCCENDVKVTNSLCCMACNVSRQDVDKWASGAAYAYDPRYKEFAIMLRRVCSTYREQMAADGKVNPVLAIWWNKVYDGYREDTIQAAEASQEKKLTAEQIKEKYKDMPS